MAMHSPEWHLNWKRPQIAWVGCTAAAAAMVVVVVVGLVVTGFATLYLLLLLLLLLPISGIRYEPKDSRPVFKLINSCSCCDKCGISTTAGAAGGGGGGGGAGFLFAMDITAIE